MLASSPEEPFAVEEFEPSAPSDIAVSGVAGVSRSVAGHGRTDGVHGFVEPAFDLEDTPTRVSLVLEPKLEVLATDEQRQLALNFLEIMNRAFRAWHVGRFGECCFPVYKQLPARIVAAACSMIGVVVDFLSALCCETLGN
jgi:hypothetical protein